jgi:hypothetical protein
LRILIDKRKYINLIHDNPKNILEIGNKIIKTKEIEKENNNNLQNNKNKIEESFSNVISNKENNKKTNEKKNIKDNSIISNTEIKNSKTEQK